MLTVMVDELIVIPIKILHLLHRLRQFWKGTVVDSERKIYKFSFIIYTDCFSMLTCN